MMLSAIKGMRAGVAGRDAPSAVITQGPVNNRDHIRRRHQVRAEAVMDLQSAAAAVAAGADGRGRRRQDVGSEENQVLRPSLCDDIEHLLLRDGSAVPFRCYTERVCAEGKASIIR